jgi:WD40 repeat protein
MRLVVPIVLLALTAALSEPTAAASPRLAPAGRIGTGWDDDLWKDKKWGWMSFVSFDRTGTRIASDGATSNDDVSGNLSIWSFPSGKLLKRLPGRPTTISARWRYYATQQDVRSMNGGAIVVRGRDYVTQAFSPDERFVVQSNANFGTRIVDLHHPSAIRILGRHAAFALSVDSRNRRIAAGYWDAVGLWDVNTGNLKAMLRGIGRYVSGIAFSPKGQLLAVSTDLGGLQLWNLASRKRLHSVSLPGGMVSIPAFSPNGRLVAVGVYGTGTVWLIDVRSGRVIDHQQVSDLGCGSAAFSPNGRYLITPSTGGLITWPHDNGGKTRVFTVAAGLH